MSEYNVLLSTDEMTVVDEYERLIQNRINYQSEEELENFMIESLVKQGYEYAKHIKSADDAIKNLRNCLENLNHYQFTDNEWNRFLNSYILNKNDSIKDKTRTIQVDFVKTLERDDGTSINIRLIDKKNIHNNHLQVINQYEASGNFDNRYDVTILVNGFPLVHTELKRRGVAIREAFNQIDRYQRDSFWAEAGLFEYVQIFVISNGTHTKYYSNTTRFNVVEYNNGKRKARKEGSTTFEFTSFWADGKNNRIDDLADFVRTFLTKHTLLSILTKYCVFTVDENLLVLRPYQIVAVEKVLTQLNISENYHKFGSKDAGGYIWHTTGSGKTLTSFVLSQLATSLPYIDKVLFVVDRNDLDYQTMKEYNKFEKGAADGNTSTAVLQKQLESEDSRIIITTIQKLGVFMKNNKSHPIYNKNVVLIFDECHRSHFGKWHEDIVKHFKKYAIFGFTGTPIFGKNANKGNNPNTKTTEQTFGVRLHTYTVVDAINDGNVLPFKVDFINTFKYNNADEELVEAIDDEALLLKSERVANVVDYILTHFNQKTFRNNNSYYWRKNISNVSDVARGKKEETMNVKVQGFNSIFAVSSIKAAKVYYEEFKKQMEERPELRKKVAVIYSYGVNEEDQMGFVDDENPDSADRLNQSDRDFLEYAISEYNNMFGTQYDTSSNLYPNYYKDISMRMKNGEIDILIVVNMFLTGFDATGLNTLWVDKNLRLHGLIQAFSRTNRILNSVKKYGNIVCFRNLRKELDEAISLFGDEKASGIVLLKSYKDYYEGYDEKVNGKMIHHKGYRELVDMLKDEYPLPFRAVRESEQKGFVNHFGSILRTQNILRSFDDFENDSLLTDAEMQDYLSEYNDLYQEMKLGRLAKEKVNVNDDVVFEMELVRQIVVDIDYILDLIEKSKNNINSELKIKVMRAISSNPELRPKKELVDRFISQLDDTNVVYEKWEEFVEAKKESAINKVIEDEKLNEEKTKELMNKFFRLGEFSVSTSDISDIMPAMSLFGGVRAGRIEQIEAKLRELFDIYKD